MADDMATSSVLAPLALRCGELEAENAALRARVGELNEQLAHGHLQSRWGMPSRSRVRLG